MSKKTRIYRRVFTIIFLVASAIILINTTQLFSLQAIEVDMSLFIRSSDETSSSWFTSRIDGEHLYREISFSGLDGSASSLASVGAIESLGFTTGGIKAFSASDNLYNEHSEFIAPGGYFIYRINYTFTYNCFSNNPLDVYVRFNLSDDFLYKLSSMGLISDLQTMMFADAFSGSLIALPLLEFAGENAYFYYPHPLSAGEVIELAFIFTLSEEIDNSGIHIDLNSLFRFDLVQVQNNASVINWNVIIENGTVRAFYEHDLRIFQYLGAIDLSLILTSAGQNGGSLDTSEDEEYEDRNEDDYEFYPGEDHDIEDNNEYEHLEYESDINEIHPRDNIYLKDDDDYLAGQHQNYINISEMD